MSWKLFKWVMHALNKGQPFNMTIDCKINGVTQHHNVRI